MKKSTTKIKKVQIAKIAENKKKFDLSANQSEEEKSRIILAMQSLIISDGWRLLKQTFQANIDFLDGQIISKISSESGEKLNETDCDRLRDKREVMTELLKKPDELLKTLQRVEQPEPDYDPYE